MASTDHKWAGMVTNASPYALPPGACVMQVNMTNAIPGQITSRAGMLPVRFLGQPGELLDVYPYEAGGKTYIVGLNHAGKLIALESPAYGESPAATETSLDVQQGEVRTSYTMRYVDGSFGAVIDTPPASGDGPATNTLDGNPDHGFYVDAALACDAAAYTTFDAGNASTGDLPPTVQLDRLCDL